jgi:hypothetical protein
MRSQQEIEKQMLLGIIALEDHTLLEKITARSKEIVDRILADISDAKEAGQVVVEYSALALAVIDVSAILEEEME